MTSLLISRFTLVNSFTVDYFFSFFLGFVLAHTISDKCAFEIIFDFPYFSSKTNCLLFSGDQNLCNSGLLFLFIIISNSSFFSSKANFSLFLKNQNSHISALLSLFSLALYAKFSSIFIPFKICTFLLADYKSFINLVLYNQL